MNIPMKKKPVNGKIKGSVAERELADLLMAWARVEGVNLCLTRNLEQTRGGGCDLNGLEDFGLFVECKRHEVLSINTWWQQACRQAGQHGTPVLAWRKNRHPWQFMVRAWVYPCAETLDITMDTQGFRKWFIARLKCR